jgi:acyl-CoA thioester hydrolase
MTFCWPVRVYYQHTDAGGVVFHGDYLNFMEAGRAEMLREMGFEVGELARRDGVLFVVHELSIVYHRAARLGDTLEVRTRCQKVGGARLVLDQEVVRGEETLTSAEITLACVDAQGHRPMPVPAVIKKALEQTARELKEGARTLGPA